MSPLSVTANTNPAGITFLSSTERHLARLCRPSPMGFSTARVVMYVCVAIAYLLGGT